jgi:nucleotide-binding universal stress UspA family protein
MYQRILIALEGKQTDHAMLCHVQQLASRTKATVSLLRVIAVADDGGGGLGRRLQLEVGSSGWRRKKEAALHLSRCAWWLRQSGLPVETAVVVGAGSEGDEIVDYAAENGFDLIVMTSDSRPWYQRLLGPAQDDDVLRKVTVPTLFVNDGTRKPQAPYGQPKPNQVMAVLGDGEL